MYKAVIIITKVKVLNVGQGDSFIISPDIGCMYDNKDIFVDVGDQTYDVFQHRSTNRIIMLITHSHMDHMGGLTSFFNGYSQHLEAIWMPKYFKEINVITGFILKLNGIKHVSRNNGNLINAQMSASAANLLNHLSSSKNVSIEYLYDGIDLCNHITVFNPPCDDSIALGISDVEIDSYFNELRDNNYSDFRSWFTPNGLNSLMTLIGERADGNNSNDRPNDFVESERDHYNYNIRFIIGLLYKLKGYIESFVNKPTDLQFNKLYQTLEQYTNNISVVFKYDAEDFNILFTGDAGKEVFYRLIEDEMPLQSNIIKIPHHGSKKNVNKKILQYINPNTAIVSHDNGIFGRQKDPHPNIEVVNLLDTLGINTLYTNDVIKNNHIIKSKPNKIDFDHIIKYYESC